MTASNVFLALPTYDGTINTGAARSAWSTASRLHRVNVMPSATSLLPTNCNGLWCTALNHRASANLTWFAMLHADVEPSPGWLDTLIAEAEQHEADLVSAVVPLKNLAGLTSTAISKPGQRYGVFCRLTMQQHRHPLFPLTFGIHEAAEALERLPEPLRVTGAPRESLLVNTGCFVCRIDRAWCERVWFANDDAIVKVGDQWKAVYQSEDWVFSRRVAEQGGKVMATKAVDVAHHGAMQYRSSHTWGQARDDEYLANTT